MKTPIILQIPNAAATVGEDGWAQLAPYGTFPGVAITADGPRRAQQVVDAEAAASLINSVKSLTGRASRFFRSIPFFHGHPDAPGLESSFPDAKPKGFLADIQAREDGIYVRPALNEEGAALVNGGLKLGLSAFVDADILTDADGLITARWSRLRSIGITPEPNLPVQMLNQRTAPESDSSSKTPTMNQSIIIAALVGAGVQIANSATEDQVVQSIRSLAEKAATSTQLANTREHEINRLNTEVVTLKTRVTEAETQLANTQGERIKDLLDERVTSGAITEADRAVWEGRLKANFANESKALRGLNGTLKTTSAIANGGARRPQEEGGSAEHFAQVVQAGVAEKKPKSEAIRSAIAAFPNSYAAWREAGSPHIPGV